ncbi:hypothetical protein GF389_02115 [Candidatus Dojkabacteria bacterium]|nr:hypothetical protein [Candidatus Dojkabacteria bacterium]
MSDEKAKQLREKVQSQVVALITERLKAGEMTQERSKKIASMVLEKMPEDINYKELMNVIPKLDDEFGELAEVVIPIMTEYEKKLHKAIENRVLSLVREKKFKEAMIEARRGIELEKRLT